MIFPEREMESNKQLFPMLDGGFARPKEQFTERDAACTCRAGDFRLGTQCQQGNRTVGSREGMSDIASQCSHVTDLGSRDQVAGLDQGPGVFLRKRVQRNAVDRDSRADEELIPSYFEHGHLGNGRDIQQRVQGCMPALFQVE